jgi:sulfur carrier protein ThiS
MPTFLCYVIAMKVEWEKKIYEFDRPMFVSKLLEEFSLSKEAHLVIANGSLITEDCKLGIEDNVKLIRVISGG